MNLILLTMWGCGEPTATPQPPTDTGAIVPQPVPSPLTPFVPVWEPDTCGVALVDGVHTVDRCRAWVSGLPGEGFGIRVRAGDWTDGSQVSAGGLCNLVNHACNTGIRLLDPASHGLFQPETHTWMRDSEVAGYGDGLLGIGFDFVGAVGTGTAPVIVDRDQYGVIVLDDDVAPPEVVTPEHPGLLFDADSNGVYTHACGDVTGNGHADLCLQGHRIRVYEGPVTTASQPWMIAAGPGGPGISVFGTFLPGQPAMVAGYDWVDGFRGGVAYVPLVAGHHTFTESDMRLIGEQLEAQVGDSVGAGDLDGDGDDELIVAETFHDEWTGRIKVYSDTPDDPFGTLVLTLNGDIRHGRFGFRTIVEDLNADGHPDLIVGSLGSYVLPGAVHIFPGPVDQMSWATAITWVSGSDLNDQFGGELATLDTDGDGDLELIVGAARFSDVAPYAGAVFSIDDPLPATD